jgi:glycosyltransferase involved in cell wall biosynthesis
MVIPSRQEAMSIVVLEAGVVGVPVVLTNQCGLNDLELINAGIVVSPTVLDIKNGLLKSLNNPQKLEDLGKNLKEHVYKNYLWTSVVKKIETLYESIVSI